MCLPLMSSEEQHKRSKTFDFIYSCRLPKSTVVTGWPFLLSLLNSSSEEQLGSISFREEMVIEVARAKSQVAFKYLHLPIPKRTTLKKKIKTIWFKLLQELSFLNNIKKFPPCPDLTLQQCISLFQYTT